MMHRLCGVNVLKETLGLRAKILCNRVDPEQVLVLSHLGTRHPSLRCPPQEGFNKAWSLRNSLHADVN